MFTLSKFGPLLFVYIGLNFGDGLNFVSCEKIFSIWLLLSVNNTLPFSGTEI